MADWKQITARIRRARSSKDPAGQLSNLFEKTRDAMVAFELARHLETAGQPADAAKWYSTAAERFRRADWKSKAQEAANRLGAQPPVEVTPSASESAAEAAPAAAVVAPEAFVETAETVETEIDVAPEPEPQISASPESPAAAKPPGAAGRRRRGRRGGRNRRKGIPTKESVAAPATKTAGTQLPEALPGTAADSAEPLPAKVSDAPVLRLPLEPGAEAGGAARRGRYGDPGLSSRLSLLEMQFRRLLTCAPVKLDEANTAPAGPGVFLITDSDLTSYYYVEACQTLRIAIPNLLRGGSTRRGADSIKPQLAEHLGIPEARVGKYLADHCVVRWLQLDEGASHFAHFVMAVLRPVLNE
jgi:hypothetical protein